MTKNIVQELVGTTEELGYQIAHSLLKPRFRVSMNQHKRIMEILNIQSNRTKKMFMHYEVIVENGHTD